MMNRNQYSRIFKVAFLAAGMSGATLFAAVTIDPTTQPAMTVVPYTLQESNLYTTGTAGTKAYRAWYENGAWMGDLIEYDITSTGGRSTDVDVGFFPPAYPVDNDGDGHTNWSARSVFAGAEGQGADGTTSNPQQYDNVLTNADYWKEPGVSGRYIFTYDGSSQISFLWDNLTTAQKASLDSSLDPAIDYAGAGDAYPSDVMNFIRGDRSNEFPDGVLRRRYSLIGDIVNSQPVYVGAPVAGFTLTDYSTYKNNQASRAGRVYVGANDGMLHAFDASDGSEAFAYIPSMLIDDLDNLASRPYSHNYYVDGQLYAGDAHNGTAWGTYLAGGLGAGGKGVWALDITNPAYTSSKIVWERNAGETSPPTGYDPSDMGYIHKRPQIALFPNGKWYVATGNGYDSSSGDSVLYLFPLDGSSDVVTHTALSDVGNGMSGVTLVDADGDFDVDYGYAGDLKGNLYKFTFTGTGDSPTVTTTKLFTTTTGRPITVAPDVASHPRGGYIVYFGTGSLLSSADAADTTSQGVYGIWDKPSGSYPITGGDVCDNLATDAFEGLMLCQTLSEETFGATDVRYSTQNAFDYDNHYGWRVDLPDSGERLIGNPQVRAERVQFTTTTVTSTSVEEIDSWLMGLDWLTGSDGEGSDEVIYDLNQDGDLDNDDRVIVDVDGTDVAFAPVALNLGEGNLSQPTIARVSGGVDIHYINGIRMPAPEPGGGPILGGLIDVTTDTPFGGNTTDSFSPGLVDEDLQDTCDSYSMTVCDGSPATSVTRTNDGYSGLPDGHVHAYDKVHGTSYVDYLDLEPRRGDPRLDAYTGDGSVTDSGSPFYQTTNADGNYTVHDTYARLDRLGVEEGDEEPWETSAATSTIDDEQKFIVVLANADLSPGPMLQIGCRTWKVQEYQDMITSQLEDGKTPSQLQDTYHGNDSLIFTLKSIREDNYDGLGTGTCAAETLDNGIEKSEEATLRILFYNRVVQDLSILPTLPQCVWGIHEPDVRFDYPVSGYIDPASNPLGHLTPAQESQYEGHRWRNGALTMQLLKVNNSTNAAEYTLQSPTGTYTYKQGNSDKTASVVYLPINKNNNRVGGVIAQAFKAQDYVDEGMPFVSAVTANQSGMLYESTVFFDMGAWFNFKTGSASLYCYGASAAHSRLVQEVVQGMDWGHYTQLTDVFFTDGELNDLYYEYLDLVNAVQGAGSEEERRSALQALSDFFANNPLVQVYDKLRDWRGDKVWQKENTGNEDRILPIDLSDYDGGGGAADDGTPITVDDISRNLTPVLGPNFILGRRTWIDLMRQ